MKEAAKKAAKRPTAKRPTTCETCSLLRGGSENHKCACDWSKMTPAERKAERKHERAASAQRRVTLKRIDLHLDLSPSNAQELLASLKPWLDVVREGTTQLQFGVRDLKSIYIYLDPTQLKKLVARLKALTMEVAR